MSEQVKFPIARVIGGSVYKSRPKESNGQPVFVKGSNPPIQAVEYSLGIAIPKHGEQNWQQTEWGAVLEKEGRSGHPQMCMSPTFSWKVTDGDSPFPNSLGRIPREQEGYAGNWIVWSKNNRPPQLCNPRGEMLFKSDAIYTGCYVQIVANVAPNVVTGTQKPGIYVNLEAVCFIGHGEQIATSSVDVNSIKWDSELPPGASATPLGGATQQTATPIQPNYAILQPAAPPPPINTSEPVLIGAAAGFTLDQMLAVGWTLETLKQNGMLA